ncbi:hypothetical protein ALC60_04354 [Trachymyrmex zeteki]|uniref:Uncharacterized protein n=1 Tax=Mycetomoellerius zeteki TaxID=64791 RepID=A0A151X8Q2_9HYME|nr:hypothetical protein ALC60_04354 [Trachymyrmex zeteki]
MKKARERIANVETQRAKDQNGERKATYRRVVSHVATPSTYIATALLSSLLSELASLSSSLSSSSPSSSSSSSSSSLSCRVLTGQRWRQRRGTSAATLTPVLDSARSSPVDKPTGRYIHAYQQRRRRRRRRRHRRRRCRYRAATPAPTTILIFVVVALS